jgi:predicted nuclease of predicted toxin-antitoxin system
MKLLRQMRILLDENFPADFATLLVGHDASNVHSHGWAAIKNGELLRRAHGVCEVFVTLDRNLEFQQNIKILPFGGILLAASQVGPGRVMTVGA